MNIFTSECLEAMKSMPENSVDSIVTDPPYGLSFMGKKWDYDVPSVEIWQEAMRVLKPGGHLLSFAGSRTYHRMAVNIEDAGFEIRDQIMWVYGSGFPKSHNIGKAVDKLQGNEREVIKNRTGAMNNSDSSNAQSFTKGDVGFKTHFTETKGSSPYEGWGTALKPAHEPIVVARKPLSEKTIAKNVLEWGTGGINIDQCRVGTEEIETGRGGRKTGSTFNASIGKKTPPAQGRFPANFLHDGSDEVVGLFPGEDDKSASRFFYVAKASKKDRNEGCEELEERKTAAMAGNLVDGQRLSGKGEPIKTPVRQNHHPTVKPTALMQYLVRLVTPKGGTVLDPFMGSGSTGKACALEGFDFIGIEMNPEYVEIAKARIEEAKNK